MKKLINVFMLLLIISSCKKEESSGVGNTPLKISVQLNNNGQPLTTTDTYINQSGESYRVSVFKFYISAIKLIASDNTITAEQDSYHLVDLAKSESKEINAGFAAGTFNKIEFMIGVDSIRNVSGAQTGALDPLNGMFWTWNSGYIFAKLEGNSSASTEVGQKLTYHIGGFKTGENAIRKITLSFPANQPVTIGKTTLLVIESDLSKWFDGPQKISIAQNPSLMTPGGISLKIADNYASMFTVKQVINP